MIDKYDAGEHNHMSPPYRMYTVEEAPEPISAQAIWEAQQRIEKLLEKHSRPQLNIWQDIL